MTAKVTIHKAPTPSEALVADAISEVVVHDDKGRAIKLKKPNPLAQFKLVKMLGQTAENQTYVGMVLPLLFVVEIEGDPIAFPRTESELEATILRLDDHGLKAVMLGVEANWGAVDKEAEEAEIKK